MISNLLLRFGRGQGASPISFVPGHMTVFVGPNNSGKSLILREIDSSLNEVNPFNQQDLISAEHRKIISNVTYPQYAKNELKHFLERNRDSHTFFDLLTGQQRHVDFAQLHTLIEQDNRADMLHYAAGIYRRTQVCMLDGLGRLNLVTAKPGGSLGGAPQSHIQALFTDDGRREKLKRATKEAFGLYVFVDPTTLGQLRFCLSADLPDDPDIERSLTARAVEFFSKTDTIESSGDGVKAYTGIIASVLSTDVRVILIDEPEAFLYPPLAQN